MDESGERWSTGVMNGADRTAVAAVLRGALRLAAPAYATGMRLRNALFDRRILKSHLLPRPAISVGNLTTGGTGKTPVVRWLAANLIKRGLRPAVLMRGYGAETAGESDERRMLADALPGAAVVANPDRRAGAMTALRELPKPDVFVLDDAFQHRKVARDFDLVLIDATAPFGFNHVLPRGLLREPMPGLHRADAVVVTRSNQVTSQALSSVEGIIRRYQSATAIYFASHVHAGLRSSASQITAPADMSMEMLAGKRFFAFAGIANPQSLRRQLESFGRCVGFLAFADHHAYGDDDLARVRRQAAQAGSEVLVTTEKDWVKIRQLPAANDGMPILRLELAIEFRESDGDRLMKEIEAAIKASTVGLRPA